MVYLYMMLFITIILFSEVSIGGIMGIVAMFVGMYKRILKWILIEGNNIRISMIVIVKMLNCKRNNHMCH